MTQKFEVEKCLGCVMVFFDCVLHEEMTEYIKDCPCHNCLVKVTCSYDNVCDVYSKFQDELSKVEGYEKRLEWIETRSNMDYYFGEE